MAQQFLEVEQWRQEAVEGLVTDLLHGNENYAVVCKVYASAELINCPTLSGFHETAGLFSIPRDKGISELSFSSTFWLTAQILVAAHVLSLKRI